MKIKTVKREKHWILQKVTKGTKKKNFTPRMTRKGEEDVKKMRSKRWEQKEVRNGMDLTEGNEGNEGEDLEPRNMRNTRNTRKELSD